jgi:hypothetical protein
MRTSYLHATAVLLGIVLSACIASAQETAKPSPRFVRSHALPVPVASAPAPAPAAPTVVYAMASPNGTPAVLPADVEQAASCVVQVDGGADQFNMYQNPVAMVLGSTAFCDPAIAATVKLPAGALGKQVIVMANSSGRCVRVEVWLKKADKAYEAGAADALLKDLVARLPRALRQSAEAERRSNAQQLEAAETAVEAAKVKLKAVTANIQSVQEVLGQTGNYGYGYNTMAAVQNLRSQKHQTHQELRQLRSQLANLAPSVPEAVAILKAELKADEERLTTAEAEVKAGKGKAATVDELRGKIAELKAQVTVSKEPAPEQEAPQQAFAQQQVRQLKVRYAELDSRLREQERQLASLTSSEMAEKLASFNDMQQEEQRLRNELSELRQHVFQLQRTARQRTVPTVSVLDGK